MPLLRALARILLSLALAASASAQLKFGTILVAAVKGTVTKTTANHVFTVLKAGDLVTETETVATDRDGGAVLFFSSGSMIALGRDSLLEITRYRMDPLSQPITFAAAPVPTVTAETALNLPKGELTCDVHHLALSSRFEIRTPAGNIGIRGTIFRAAVTPTPSELPAFFTLSTLEGLVLFNPRPGLANPSQSTVPVVAGKEIVLSMPEKSDTAGSNSAPLIATLDIAYATHQLVTTTLHQAIDPVAHSAVISVAAQQEAAAQTK